MKDLPYFRWWVARAETDEAYQMMNDTERGFYHRCMNKSWVNIGIPENLDDLAALMGTTREYLDSVWPRVSRKWYAENGRFFNKTQEEERAYAVKLSDKNKRAGNASAQRRKRECSTDVEHVFNTCSTDVPTCVEHVLNIENASVSLRAYDSDSITEHLNFDEPEEKHGTVWFNSSFERWWPNYWNKTAKAKARVAYERRVKLLVRDREMNHTQAEEFLIMAAIDDRGRSEATDAWGWRVNLHPPTWLSQERWNDEAPPQVKKASAAKVANGNLPAPPRGLCPCGQPWAINGRCWECHEKENR